MCVCCFSPRICLLADASSCLLLPRPPPPPPRQVAVSDAYDRTLAQIHAWVVRAGIKTGMMALPTRDHFLASIGETGGWMAGPGLSSRPRADAPSKACSAEGQPPKHVPLPQAPPPPPATRRAEDSARGHAEGFVDAAHKLVGMIDKLYEGVEMPRRAGGAADDSSDFGALRVGKACAEGSACWQLRRAALPWAACGSHFWLLSLPPPPRAAYVQKRFYG